MQLNLLFGRMRRRLSGEEEITANPPAASLCGASSSTSSCGQSMATLPTCTILSSSSTLPDSPYTIKSEDEGAAADYPSCWLCLEEGSDATGKALIRDCSCRGTSGFAHISCIINYAEHKGRQCYESSNQNSTDVCRYFKFCPNCNQEYQNDVQGDLSEAMVSFVERKIHDGTPRASYLRIVALVDRLIFLSSSGTHEEGSTEGQVICSKLMFLMDGMDRDMKAKAYYALGCYHDSIGCFKKSNGFLEMARNILQGADSSDNSSVRDISEIEIKLDGSNTSIDVDSLRKQYEETLAKSRGRETTLTIDAGVSLAKALRIANRNIEAEKLLANLVATSRRVHGQDHRCTKSALIALEGLRSEEPMSIDAEFGDVEGWFQSV